MTTIPAPKINIRAPDGILQDRFDDLRANWKRVETPEGVVYVKGTGPLGVWEYSKLGEGAFYVVASHAADPKRGLIAAFRPGDGKYARFAVPENAVKVATDINDWLAGKDEE